MAVHRELHAAAEAMTRADVDHQRIGRGMPAVARLSTPRADLEVPVVGLIVTVDHATEQEAGVGQVLRSLCPVTRTHSRSMSTKTRRHASLCGDANAFAISSANLPDTFAWGADLPGARGAAYSRHHEHALETWDPRDAYLSAKRRATVADLRAQARAAGLGGVSRLGRDAVLDALFAHEHPGRVAAPSASAYFDRGETMVVRAEAGSLADRVVSMLRAAIEARTFALTRASGPFAAGLLMYDAAEETKELLAARAENDKWHAAQMKALASVQKDLEAKGHRFFFLGNPREGASGDVAYWLNGMAGRGAVRQPCGWYTLDQLRAEKFIADANARARA